MKRWLKIFILISLYLLPARDKSLKKKKKTWQVYGNLIIIHLAPEAGMEGGCNILECNFAFKDIHGNDSCWRWSLIKEQIHEILLNLRVVSPLLEVHTSVISATYRCQPKQKEKTCSQVKQSREIVCGFFSFAWFFLICVTH